jgi:hypothetical protein
MNDRCRATKKDGSPCAAPPLLGRELCLHHAPEKRDDLARSRRAGGEARARGLARAPMEPPPEWWPLQNITEASRGLAHVSREVLVGRLDPRSANAATGALNALVGALRGADLEERVRGLEAALGVEGGKHAPP